VTDTPAHEPSVRELAAAAGALRALATDRLTELDHAHLTWPGGEVSIVAVDEVKAWLEGWAIRIENGNRP
jgi:hypothetical protein